MNYIIYISEFSQYRCQCSVGEFNQVTNIISGLGKKTESQKGVKNSMNQITPIPSNFRHKWNKPSKTPLVMYSSINSECAFWCSSITLCQFIILLMTGKAWCIMHFHWIGTHFHHYHAVTMKVSISLWWYLCFEARFNQQLYQV